MTAIDLGFMMRFIAERICSWVNRSGWRAARSSTRNRTSTAVAPPGVANTGFRSTSASCGKSETRSETRWMRPASASRSTGSAPRTPRSTSAAAIPSSMDSASSLLVGASRKVTSPTVRL